MNKNVFKSKITKLLSIFKEEECGRCHTKLARPPHTCPFSSEINDDNETLCDCCDECEYECAMEI